jgi:hypothetical protein
MPVLVKCCTTGEQCITCNVMEYLNRGQVSNKLMVVLRGLVLFPLRALGLKGLGVNWVSRFANLDRYSGNCPFGLKRLLVGHHS